MKKLLMLLPLLLLSSCSNPLKSPETWLIEKVKAETDNKNSICISEYVDTLYEDKYIEEIYMLAFYADSEARSDQLVKSEYLGEIAFKKTFWDVASLGKRENIPESDINIIVWYEVTE